MKRYATMRRGFMATLFISCSVQMISNALDTITTTQFMKDGETIISSGGSFELGFFSPGNTKNRYVGIWYKKFVTIKTVVWVANREVPLNNTFGVLKVINPGQLVLVNGYNNTIWSTNTSRIAGNPVALLLDSGNLVVKEANDDNPQNFLWQGFDYPSDTLLPGMKLGRNLVTGIETYISSWKSSDDPAPGEYSGHCVTTGYPQTTLQKGSVLLARSGLWNGLRFTGSPSLAPNTIFRYELVFNEKEVFYRYSLLNSSVISRFVLHPTGVAQRWRWVNPRHDWVVNLGTPIDNCDTYSLCGAHGVCNIARAPLCGCLDKFVPKNKNEWDGTDWSHGCVRRTPLDCKNGDGFLNYQRLKLPDTKGSWFNTSMTLEECEMVCLQNCSCTAYSNLDIRGAGSGCLLWFGDLIDIREFSQGGQDIYIRMASSELEHVTAIQSGSNTKKGATIRVILPLIFGIVLASLSLAFYFWRRRKNSLRIREERLRSYTEQDYKDSHKEDVELPMIPLSKLVNATKNFSVDNKLGEGGFGSVYKGVMVDGQEIAVKRLSKTSSQGLKEFKNEVICISKLQHRNLVKLRGCCIQGDEKMLIYEFLPNKSLDSFIFDELKSKLLDWPKRFHIIKGIARGLLYLHQDSRLRIIHRDLKTSNILLDYEMNPKISDFGLARSFEGDETGANTNRVVGTYGYMSPEYAADGLFSVKSDVYSFGVIVMEIVSGKKNRGFFHQEHEHNLLGHAWRLYKEGKPLELMDAPLGNWSYESEAIRSIEVGLLCAQQQVKDRPTMCSVVTMLDSKSALPRPKQPGFFADKNASEAECSSSTYSAPFSLNDITITQLDGRL